MKRKIVQIAMNAGVAIALADDGSVWEGYTEFEQVASPQLKFVWHQLPGLPNDDANLSKVR